MQLMVKHHKEKRGDLHTLPEYAIFQINDTHPTLAIPELMRILMDEEGFGWEEAEDIVSQIFNCEPSDHGRGFGCWDRKHV